MNLPLWIGLRYLRRGGRRFANVVMWVSVIGISLGVLVLTVVVSVMNGFDRELKNRLLGTIPHAVALERTPEDPAIAQLIADPRVQRAYPFLSTSGMVSRNGGVNPVSVFAIEPDGAEGLKTIADHMLIGSLDAVAGSRNGIALGGPLARHLGLIPGQTVALILIEPTPGSVRPKLLRFDVVALFEIGAELDYSLAIVPLSAVPDSIRSGSGLWGVRLDLFDPLSVEQLIADHSFDGLEFAGWQDTYGELFRAVRIEKSLMFLVLLMVVAVAGFNVVSGQTMTVRDKTGDIAILRTMGADAATVRRIFLFQGLAIATSGILVGLMLGVVVARNASELMALVESVSSYRLLEGTYFTQLPTEVRWIDLSIIGAISWSLCALSSWIPAARAADLNPVDGLHRT